ncbi:MAG: hypothetical protein RIQ52_1875 [Pseudomonadota bacterium]|jgi:ribosome-associated protein
MHNENIVSMVLAVLDEGKGRDVTVIDVRNRTDFTDYMIVASGTSDRHVRSLAFQVLEKAKQENMPYHGLEGEGDGEWVLVDLGDAVIHVMKPQAREFYQLEKLWQGQEA